ncbi:hypothetical protein COCOBI_08-1360 [Coccomyxa sp. Obi]|nr:hypothetical protein COCOBI_08-1360 [Coccomyxa sp. Obi]
MDSVRRNLYLAASLLAIGSVTLITGVSLYFSEDEDADGIALTSLGCVVFLPGLVYSWSAFRSWQRHEGYSEEFRAIK